MQQWVLDFINDEKFYFDFELEDGTKIEGLRFMKILKPIYVNNGVNEDLYGYSPKIVCLDRNEKEVDYEFLHQNIIVKRVYYLEEKLGDITHWWLKEKFPSFWETRRILGGLKGRAGETIYDPFVSEVMNAEDE